LGPNSEREMDASSPPDCTTELDADFQRLSVRGWVAYRKRDGPDLIRYLQSEWIETALYFLKVIVNRQLNEHLITRSQLDWVRYEQLGWKHVPSSLIGLLWLQFA